MSHAADTEKYGLDNDLFLYHNNIATSLMTQTTQKTGAQE